MISVNSTDTAYTTGNIAAQIPSPSPAVAPVKAASAPRTSSPVTQSPADPPPPSYNPAVLVTLTLEAQAYLALMQR